MSQINQSLQQASGDFAPPAVVLPTPTPATRIFATALDGTGIRFIPLDATRVVGLPAAANTKVSPMHTVLSNAALDTVLRHTFDDERDADSQDEVAGSPGNASIGGALTNSISRHSESSASVTPRLLSDLQQHVAPPSMTWTALSPQSQDNTNRNSPNATTDLFLGQICRHYSVEILTIMIDTLAGHHTVRRVKPGPRNVCAFVSVDAVDADALCRLHKRVLCDVSGIWVAHDDAQAELMHQIAERHYRSQQSGRASVPMDRLGMLPPSMPHSAMVIERPRQPTRYGDTYPTAQTPAAQLAGLKQPAARAKHQHGGVAPPPYVPPFVAPPMLIPYFAMGAWPATMSPAGGYMVQPQLPFLPRHTMAFPVPFASP